MGDGNVGNEGGPLMPGFSSHSIGLSVLAFWTISHDLMPTTIPFQFKNQFELKWNSCRHQVLANCRKSQVR